MVNLRKLIVLWSVIALLLVGFTLGAQPAEVPADATTGWAATLTGWITQAGVVITALLAALGGTETTVRVKRKMDLGPRGSQILNAVATGLAGTASAKMTGLSWTEAVTATPAGWGAGQAGYKAKKRKNPPIE